MEKRWAIFTYSHRCKRAAFLVLWAVSLPGLMIISARNDPGLDDRAARNSQLEISQLKNTIKGLTFSRWGCEHDNRPIYFVHFADLQVENNDLGLFKTAICKVVRIRDLTMEYYQYCSPADSLPPKLASDTSLKPLEKPRPVPTSKGTSYPLGPRVLPDIVDLLTRPPEKGKWRMDIDLSNTVEVIVSGFEYKEFDNNRLRFAVQSKKAVASYDSSSIELRGHVILRTANGDTLQGNCARWDVKCRQFRIRGLYVLDRAGTKTIGKDIWVSFESNCMELRNAKAQQEGSKEWRAKL